MKNVFYYVITLAAIAGLSSSCSGNTTSEQSTAETTEQSEIQQPVDAQVAETQPTEVQDTKPETSEAVQETPAEANPQAAAEVKADPEVQFEEDFDKIKNNIKTFYEGAVLSTGGTKRIPWTKSALSKYLTNSFIKKLKDANPYDDMDGGGAIAVWELRNPDVQDSDPNDKVLSVEKGKDQTLTVTYLDCGIKSKTRLNMKLDKDVWKINDCKFLTSY